MKKNILLMMTCLLAVGAQAQFGGFFNKVKNETEDKVSNKVSDNVSDKAANGVDNAMTKKSDSSKSSAQSGNSNSGTNTNNNNSGGNSKGKAADSTAVFKTYSNYDFVPGDTIIFADDFSGDQDGEFPSHWNLVSGQAILNKVGNDEAFCITDGNYGIVTPRMNTKSYCGNAFTVEFNYIPKDDGNRGVVLDFNPVDDGQPKYMTYDEYGAVSSMYFSNDFSAKYPGNFKQNTWHHCALIYKNGEIKCYIDQYRVLVMPSITDKLSAIGFGGIGSLDDPIIFKDVRIASGGNMNMIGKKFTAAKIVTHGINFDVDKATIKPESMGTLNMIVKIMNSNPDLKFEIDGYTDNTGDAQHNVQLSQQRADAVKAQLVTMGISATRLTTKGFGESNPISSNDSQAGQANNRRVEFVKK